MRITGGTVKGYQLAKVKGLSLRPTADRVRSSIFNALGQTLADLAVLDLFAGSGSLGIESISRGAKRALFVDNSRGAVVLIRKNLSICGFEELSKVIREELPKGLTAIKNLRCGQFDLIFIDPPYGKGLIEPTITKLLENNLLAPNGTIVAESATWAKDTLPFEISNVRLEQRRIYGSTTVSFYC
jgi:16S rRNA (guanine966-N2)-methyltransferase